MGYSRYVSAICDASLLPLSYLQNRSQGKASNVRFYRDYSIADFAFCSVTAVLAAYAAFLRSARFGLCEELSHHPDLMRDMLEIGLNLENCELWLERAVFAIVAVMFVVIVMRVRVYLSPTNLNI